MAIDAHGDSIKETTNKAQTLAKTICELVPDAHHDTTHYANNRAANDQGRLKARLRPMRGLQTDRTASVIIQGHTLMQNFNEATTNSTPTRFPG